MVQFEVGDRVEVRWPSRVLPRRGVVVDKKHHFVWVLLSSGRTIPVVPSDLRKVEQ